MFNELTIMEANMSPQSLENPEPGDHSAKLWDKVGHGLLPSLCVSRPSVVIQQFIAKTSGEIIYHR
jgi:hypothetical protein